MKQVSLVLVFIIVVAFPALAQSQEESADQLQKSVAEAYKAKTMRTLDAKKLIQGSLLVKIVHSLMEGKGSVVRRRFQTFAQFDAWLKKREREEGAPFRQVSELVKCSKGHCAYNYDNGILHNQLYLHDIYYRFRNGKPYLTRIDLLDGD
jgi:hypothetical protein